MRILIMCIVAAIASGCVYNDYGAQPVVNDRLNCATADSQCARGRG